jgi:hypothetical protein
VKHELLLVLTQETHYRDARERECIAVLVLTSTLGVSEWSASRPGRLIFSAQDRVK